MVFHGIPVVCVQGLLHLEGVSFPFQAEPSNGDKHYGKEQKDQIPPFSEGFLLALGDDVKQIGHEDAHPDDMLDAAVGEVEEGIDAAPDKDAQNNGSI